MKITPTQKKKIQTVLSVFETSSLKPRYDILVCLNDGPNDIKQITYGKHQTTEYGNLKSLIKMYCDRRGRYANDLRSYLDFIGNPRHPLSGNDPFKTLLKLAGTDQVMMDVQEEFFEQFYWMPAVKWAEAMGFTLPLSMLVIYDSYIQSGSILMKLRDRFSEAVPISKGNEKRWITAYTNVRDKFLENNQNPDVRSSDYRTDCLCDTIKEENWDLVKPLVCKFNSADKRDWITII
jgi:chitosanase